MTTKGDENELLRSVALQNATSILAARRRAEQRSEAYLAQAQRLSHTGSIGWNPSTGNIIWSEETFRIFQYDRSTKPTVELILQRVHPEDTALVKQTIARATEDGRDFEHEYRLVMPDGTVKHVHVVAHAGRDESGETEFVGAVMDVTARKHAEEALRQSEAYLAEAQRLSHTGSWAWNLGATQQFWSVETFQIYGFDRNATAPTRENFLERVHPDDRASIELVETELHKGNDAEYNYRIILPDGSIKHITSVAHPIRNDSGQVIEFVGTVMDVTERRLAEEERKRVEEALRRSESYLAEAQRLTHTGSWAWRVPGREALHLSEEWFRIYGFAPEEGLSAWEKRLQRMHPEDRAKWQETINRAISEKSDYEGEHRILLPDGTVKYTQTIGHPVLNASGDVVQFVGTMIDVTERKRAEETLRRSEGYLAEAQRLTRSGSWAWDLRTRDLFWSQEMYRILDYDPERMKPTLSHFLERVHPEDRASVEQRAEMMFAQKERVDFEADYRVVLPNGTIKHLHSINHPVTNESGEVTEVFGTTMDVTERKRADEERERLRQAQADLAHINRVTTMGELTASLAHEVNQPIAAAVTNAKTCLRWLARDQPDVEEARAAAMRIVNDGTRAAEIIKRIRLLFKKGISERELVDINEVIEEMVVLLRGEATRYSVLVRTELEAGTPRVMADRVQLQQVLMNLMINGIDAMKDADGTRELTIKSQRAESRKVLVSVNDTGVGLPPQQSDLVFEAFFSTKPHGTGMGLAISRSIVESHGGRLWASNNFPCGASFCFALPANAESKE